MLLAELGFIFYFLNLPGLVSFACLLVPAVIARINVEEKALSRTVAGYEQYARHYKRLIPVVW